MIDLFASWCEPCRRSLPDLVEVARERPDVTFLTLVVLDPSGDASRALSDAGADWPAMAIDEDHPVLADYRIVGLPDTIVVAPDGTVATVFRGGTNATALRDALG